MRRFMPFLLVSSALILTACGNSEPVQTEAPQTLPQSTASTEKAELTLEQRGRIVFKKCQACHTLDEGGANRVGPNLWNVMDNAAGSKEFAYSKAMQAADLVWDDATLNAYLTKPSAVVPKGSMVFIGLKDQEDRDAVIAYLRQETTPSE